VEKYLIYISAI